MGDKFSMSIGLAHDLELAFRRTGWKDPEEVKRLASGDTLRLVRELVLGRAGITLLTSITPVVPGDNEWFDLTVDHDADPMDVVRSSGLDPSSWKFLGPRVTGTKTYRAKLVRIGYVRNLDEARLRLDQMGCQMLDGQVRESFKQKYPQQDGKGSIVFGGSLWQRPDDGRSVAYLSEHAGGWRSYFHWADLAFADLACGFSWRWAVVGK